MPIQDVQILQTSCAVAFTNLANHYGNLGASATRDECLAKAKALLDKANATLILL